MVEWWTKYIGRPFAIKGRGPDDFDCWGLLQWIYRHDHNDRIALPGYEEFYEDTNDREEISSVIFDQKQERWREIDDPKPFDAVLLRMRGVPMHVGIVTKPGFMIHCAHGIGTVHEKYDSLRWKDKILGFYRYE